MSSIDEQTGMGVASHPLLQPCVPTCGLPMAGDFADLDLFSFSLTSRANTPTDAVPDLTRVDVTASTSQWRWPLLAWTSPSGSV